MTIRTIALGLMAALGAFASPVSAKRVPRASVRSTAYNTARPSARRPSAATSAGTVRLSGVDGAGRRASIPGPCFLAGSDADRLLRVGGLDVFRHRRREAHAKQPRFLGGCHRTGVRADLVGVRMTLARHRMHCPKCGAVMYESRPMAAPRAGDAMLAEDWHGVRPGDACGCASCGWVPVECVQLHPASVAGADSMWGILDSSVKPGA